MRTTRIHTELLAPSYSLQDVAKLRDIFRTLGNGIKAINQYPPGHPVASGFVQIFREKLDQFFTQNQALSVRVTREGVLAGDDIIAAMGEEQDNVAAVMHRDGVRSLDIKPSVTSEELENLLTSLAQCCGPEQERCDIGYLFWQAQFENIEYDIVDLFETEEVEMTWPEQEPQSKELPKELQLDPAQVELQASSLEQQFRDLFGEIDQFSDEELHSLRRMLAEHRALDLRSEGIMLLLAIYSDSESFNEQVSAIEKLKVMLDQSIREARFATLALFLDQAHDLLDHSNDDVAKRQRLAGFLLRCGDSVRLKMVTEVLNQDAEIDLEPVRNYLRLLGNDSTANLIQMLGELEHYPARKMICDLLVEKDLTRIDIIGNAIYDSRWYLVRNVVWIMGEARIAKGISFLTRAATHTDGRVRSEVVKALGKINTDESVQLLVGMLNDPSEKIATMAANELGETHSPIAFEALSELVLSKDYAYLPLVRMRQLAEALVQCDGARALGLIEKIMHRRSWLRRGRLRQAQEVLVNALQFADSDRVSEWLVNLGRAEDSFLASTARKAHKQMQTHREQKHDNG